MTRVSTIALLSCFSAADAAGRLRATAAANVNPIRKVVTLLQHMQEQVTKEGEKEEGLYKKFMCYCKTSGKDLEDGIAAAGAKIEQLQADVKALAENGGNVKEEIKQAQADRAAAKSALKDGAAVREKEQAAFDALKAEAGANVDAINKAVAALTKGMGGFLQSSAAASLRALLEKDIAGLEEGDRQTLTSFLEGSQSSSYAPQSGEIVGILKQMGDTMAKDLAEAEAAEKETAATYEKMVAAKKKEIETLTASIEAKLQQSADKAVKLVQAKNDLKDTQEGLAEDQKFLAELAKGCKTKEAEWEVVVKTRGEELLALSETIKILNDDDALELFKRTLPSAAAFVQVDISATSQKARALAAVRVAQEHSHQRDRAQLDLIALALRGKKNGFGKVISMIDDMVKTLAKDQQDDDHKVEYCEDQLNKAEDKAKDLQRASSAADASAESAADSIAAVTKDIADLEAGIKALDKDVAEATEQRKEEHAAHLELMSSDSAAKELLGFARNRLNKFYAPKLYKPAPKAELSAEERIFVSEGGTATPTPAPGGIAGTGISALAEVSVHVQGKDAPPPPPATFGAYKTKSEENTGVLAMMDLLVKDLDKEMDESSVEEKNAQEDYEQLMQDAGAKRAEDSKAITSKANTKAQLEEDLEGAKTAGANAKAELAATGEFVGELHGECDWLMKYADARREARSRETDSLKNAKAVLSGADYSF